MITKCNIVISSCAPKRGFFKHWIVFSCQCALVLHVMFTCHDLTNLRRSCECCDVETWTNRTGHVPTLSSSVLQFKDDKLLTVVNCGGRLGNKIFRKMSMYGIAQSAGRRAYIVADQNSCCYKQLLDLLDIFPNLHKAVAILDEPLPFVSRFIPLNKKIAVFKNVTWLKTVKERSVVARGMAAFQTHKYFDQYRQDVFYFLQFNEHIIKKADLLAKQIFRNYQSHHKLCVHVRRGDFAFSDSAELATDETFTQFAIQYIANGKIWEENRKTQIAAYVFGDDNQWISERIRTTDGIPMVTSPLEQNIPAAVDMCLAVRHCDSFLMSASASTYAFWIGYLLGARNVNGRAVRIYYRRKLSPLAFYEKQTHENDFFLPEWEEIDEPVELQCKNVSSHY